MLDGALGGPVEQEYLLQARQMQAMSFAVHIPLVCFGIAFPAMVLFLEGLWLRTDDPLYKALAKRWSKAMLILFAIGVVTGTILSFEMGLLWPEFMATFGDVFGLAFGIEGFSFFMEAIFIAVYVYGWDRLPDRVHFAAGVPIVLAGISGSLMVISVNGWMNNPTGFRIENGEVVDIEPLAALFNDNLWHELVHMYLAGFIVAGFLVAGVYAYAWLRGKRDRRHRVGLVVALSFAALVSPAQLLVGDWAARTVAERQPVKLAAFEGLDETTRGAGFALAGGIEIPKLLSLLAFHDPDAVVQGLDSVPEEDRPPVGIVKLSFRAMVAIGTALAALGAWFVWVWWRHGRLRGPRRPPRPVSLGTRIHLRPVRLSAACPVWRGVA
jgi:cytochrome bd ubiquinol oxidase subunit I